MKKKIVGSLFLTLILLITVFYYRNSDKDTWFTYRNEKLGISVELPKKVMGTEGCLGGKVVKGMIPLVVFEDRDSVYFAHKNYSITGIDERGESTCEKKVVDLKTLQSNPNYISFIKINSVIVTNELGVNNLVQKISNEYEETKGCRFNGLIQTSEGDGALMGEYFVDVGDELRMSGPESLCFRFPHMYYSPRANRVFYWWWGQSEKIGTEYDRRIMRSISFL